MSPEIAGALWPAAVGKASAAGGCLRCRRQGTRWPWHARCTIRDRRFGAASRADHDRRRDTRSGQNPRRQEQRLAEVSDPEARQPARARGRRDRHRQDGDAAGDGGRASPTPASRSSPPTSRATCPGIAAAGDCEAGLRQARRGIGVDLRARPFPVVFWDLFGEQGHPIRCTVSEMGPLLLARLLELNDTQEGVLNIAFRVADEQALAGHRPEGSARHAAPVCRERLRRSARQYGNVSAASVGAIQRQLLVLENQGADRSSSASRRSTSTTSCAPTATGAASSTCSPPTS